MKKQKDTHILPSENSKEPSPEIKPPQNRRALLKSLLAGSAVVSGSKALPEQWSKPLTEGIILPAHAETTSQTGDLGADQTTAGDGPGQPQDHSEGDGTKFTPNDGADQGLDTGNSDYETPAQDYNAGDGDGGDTGSTVDATDAATTADSP
jgi:hypothetical protein